MLSVTGDFADRAGFNCHSGVAVIFGHARIIIFLFQK